MEYLTFDEFRQIAERNAKFDSEGKPTGHWRLDAITQRWKYHALAIKVLRESGCDDPSTVLEMGTMGAQLVKGSDTIDIAEKWSFEGFKPTYVHDARELPWPMRDKQYEWFVALQVFHHLWPVQRECFLEACRVANNILIVVPPYVSDAASKRTPRTDAGIKPRQFSSWAGRAPKLWKPLGDKDLYWWSEHAGNSNGMFIARAGVVWAWRAAKRIVS